MENNTEKHNDLKWASEYVKSYKWTVAKTYAKTTPHQYIIVKQFDPRRDEFKHFFEIIEKYGVIEKFFGQEWKYLYLDDGYKYFSATGKGWEDDFIILNRAVGAIKYGKQ